MDENSIGLARQDEKIKIRKVLDEFVAAMEHRLFQKVDEGFVGWNTLEAWNEVSPDTRVFDLVLQEYHHLADEDTKQRRRIDIANFAMFGWWLAKRSKEATDAIDTATD